MKFLTKKNKLKNIFTLSLSMVVFTGSSFSFVFVIAEDPKY